MLLVLLVCVFVFAGDLFTTSTDESSTTTTTTVTTTVEAGTEIETETETTTESVGDSVMPSLVGKNYENQKEQYASWITFDVEEVYSDSYSAGIICWQEYEAGDYFDSSQAVKIQVSKGAATVEIPTYSGYGVSYYCTFLDDLGISYTTMSESTSSYSDGTVIRLVATVDGEETELAAGETIDLNDGYEVVVYYAYNPVTETTTEETTETETETEAEAETSADETETETETVAQAEETAAPEETEQAAE